MVNPFLSSCRLILIPYVNSAYVIPELTWYANIRIPFSQILKIGTYPALLIFIYI